MSEVLLRNEIEDSVNLIDDRTIEILRDYQFYKFAPHKIDNPAWKEAVIILNRLTPSLL